MEQSDADLDLIDRLREEAASIDGGYAMRDEIGDGYFQRLLIEAANALTAARIEGERQGLERAAMIALEEREGFKAHHMSVHAYGAKCVGDRIRIALEALGATP